MVESSHLWHDHLAHVNFNSLKLIKKLGLINFNDELDTYEISVKSKTKKNIPFSSVKRDSKISDLINSDTFEFNGMLIHGEKRYFITFVDGCTIFLHVYFIKTKNKAFDIFKIYKGEVEN